MSDTQLASDELLAPWTGERLRRIKIEALALVMEVGDVRSVGRYLRNQHVLTRADECPRAAALVASARDWLAGAIEHERLNGAGSMVDRTHPFWLNGLAPIRERAAIST